jgi:predicted ATPase/GAF domain-containing protein/HPt (histidine-containing phosphotransfer) domain-containing protein
MDKIGNYYISSLENESANSLVYRGYKDGSGQNVLIKIIRAYNSTASEIAYFKSEFERLRGLECPGVIKHFDNIPCKEGFALIFEDYEGISLSKYLNGTFLLSSDFLSIGKSIARILGEIHQKEIVHRDFRTENILINPETKEIKLANFNFSLNLLQANSAFSTGESTVSILTYISPEMTGRMNRAVDYRSDLYSAGVVFYELLTGKPPFISDDPIEIIHSHIAKRPLETSVSNNAIPEAISAIVMRLLEKNPEERYQNGFGLLADLDFCQNALAHKDTIPVFTLCQNDISLKFSVPQIMYGRDEEKRNLIDAFERVCQGNVESVFITGQPGIGKSMLVNEMQRAIIEKNGFFIWGKYDQFRKNVPYNAIIQAFTSLINKLLVENAQSLNKWADRLSEAIGDEGLTFLCDMIPSLKHIIPMPSDIKDFNAEDHLRHFNQYFLKFLRVFTSAEHPLVLFLDDIQWADAASFSLLNQILKDTDLRYLLFLGSYRTTEYRNVPNLVKLISDLQSSTYSFMSIELGALTIVHVNELISNFLHCSKQFSLELSELIHVKTGGNPFFVIQILKHLYENKFINPDAINGWKWNIEVIRQLHVSDNVVELMIRKIGNLSSETSELLTYCSCIGNRFDLETLSTVTNKPIETVLSILSIAIKEDLVHRSGEFYVFHHDRIQEAAYSIASDARKTEIHYTIGTYLLEKTPADHIDSKILYIVNQLNSGSSLINDQNELLKLVELNIKAALKGKSAAAFDIAFTYIEKALSVINNISLAEDNPLYLVLYREAAELAYLNGKHELMKQLTNKGLLYCKTSLEQVKFFDTEISAALSSGQLKYAIELSIEILKRLGFNFPKNPSKGKVLFELIKTKLQLRKYTSEQLQNLPVMDDKTAVAIISILLRFGVSAYWVSKDIYALTIFYRVQLILKKGICPDGIPTWVSLGILYNILFSDYEKAYSFGQLSIKLTDKFNIKKYNGQIYMRFYSFLHLWKHLLRDAGPKLQETFNICLESGDISTASISAIFYSSVSFFGGDTLINSNTNMDVYRKILEKNNQTVGLKTINIFRQTCDNLSNANCSNPSCLDGNFFNEIEDLKKFHDDSYLTGITAFYCLKNMLCYIFEKYDQISALLPDTNKFKHAGNSTILVPMTELFESLSIIQLARQNKNNKFMSSVHKNQKRLKKAATHSPVNFRHKWLLVNAELASLKGNNAVAGKLYDQAYEEAIANGFLIESALISELACNYYFSINRITIAQTYLNESLRFYELWGAESKIGHLRQKYAQYVTYDTRGQTTLGTATHTTATYHTQSHNATITSSLDISSVLKVSQAINGEIKFDILKNKIIINAMENAGATKGILLMSGDNNSFTIEALCECDAINSISQSISFEEFRDISHSIVNYVSKTSEQLVLGNAIEDTRFNSDEYIRKESVKSVLCLPIRHSGKTIGILYLENKLTTNAFTTDRLGTLDIISSQAAISIVNARMYASMENFNKQLEKQVQTRTTELIESQKNVTDILNSVEEAILTVNNDYTVNPEHSRSASKILDCHNFSNVTLKQILSLTDQQDQDFRKWVSYVFSNPVKPDKWLKIAKLNPVKEITIHHNGIPTILHLEYQPIVTDGCLNKIMIIGKDVTEQKRAESMLEQATLAKEQQMGRVYGLLNYDLESVKSFMQLLKNTYDMTFDKNIDQIVLNREEYNELYRFLHTLKGVGGTMGFSNLEHILHSLEEYLKQLSTRTDSQKDHEIWQTSLTLFTQEYQAIEDLFTRLFKKQENHIAVKEVEFQSLLDKLKSNTISDFDLMLFELQQLPQRTWNDLCQKYQAIIKKYSAETRKDILPLQIINGHQKINNAVAQIIDGPITHCIRNSLDHGIEEPLVRNTRGKGPGKITMSIEHSHTQITISIADDGKGLDKDLIGQKAVLNGLINQKELDSMPDTEIQTLIFHPGFSTKDTVNSFSGRGVGMDVVKCEIEKVNGSVAIQSVKNEGTTITISLPLIADQFLN